MPPAWSKATVDAAMDLVNHTITAGVVSAAAGSLTREVLKIMLLQKLKLASAAMLSVGLIAWAASAALILRGDEPRKVAPAAVAPRAVQAPAPQPAPEPDPLDEVGTFPVARPRARSGWQAGRKCRDLRPARNRLGASAERIRPRSPARPRDDQRRRRPLPVRARQGGQRRSFRQRSRLAQRAGRGRGAGIRAGLDQG